MVDFARMIGATKPGRLGEYEELLRLTCASPGPPHQILCFCHRWAGETAPGIVEDFASRDRPASLTAMAEVFEQRYSGPRSSSQWIDPREMRKLMKPLWNRLQLSLRDATDANSNWQTDNQHLLEFFGEQRCGDTSLVDYDSGTVAGRVAAWNRRAARMIGQQQAVEDGEVLAVLIAGELSPFEAIFYLRRSVFKMSYREFAAAKDHPLRALAEDLDARYSKRRPGDQTIRGHFECLYHILERPVDELPEPEGLFQDFSAVRGRIVGDLTLRHFEMSRLEADINNWTSAIKKSLVNRYYTAPKRTPVRI